MCCCYHFRAALWVVPVARQSCDQGRLQLVQFPHGLFQVLGQRCLEVITPQGKNETSSHTKRPRCTEAEVARFKEFSKAPASVMSLFALLFAYTNA